jgi:hypothetical protein
MAIKLEKDRNIWNSADYIDWDLYHKDDEKRKAFFEKIRPKEHWKFPIDAVIDETDFAGCREACIHWTGSVLEIVASLPDGKVRVKAVGYYNAIGS